MADGAHEQQPWLPAGLTRRDRLFTKDFALIQARLRALISPYAHSSHGVRARKSCG